MSNHTSSVRKRRHHKALHGKAKRAADLSEKLNRALAAQTPSHAADVAHLVDQLHPALRALRKSTLKKGGPHAKLVAAGIADLSTAFELLAQSRRTPNRATALQHLIESDRALDRAAGKARKAGNAWPL